MAGGVQLIEYTDEYLEQVLDLFRRASPDHPELADADLLKWQRAKRYLALFKENVVGHMALIPHIYLDRGKRADIGWGATLVLDQSNQLVQTFAGTMLLDQVTKKSPLKFIAVGVVPEIEHTHARRGYKVVRDSSRMYGRFMHARRALDYLNKSRWYAPALTCANAFFRPRKPEGPGRIEQIDRFNSEWDPVWTRLLSERYEAFAERTADYLNYKISQPHKEYSCLIYRSESGEVDGYVVFRLAVNPVKELTLAKVCDLVGTDTARSVLLGRAVDFAYDRRADGIVALSSLVDAPLFKRGGMWISKNYPVVVPPECTGRPHVSFFDADLDDLW